MPDSGTTYMVKILHPDASLAHKQLKIIYNITRFKSMSSRNMSAMCLLLSYRLYKYYQKIYLRSKTWHSSGIQTMSKALLLKCCNETSPSILVQSRKCLHLDLNSIERLTNIHRCSTAYKWNAEQLSECNSHSKEFTHMSNTQPLSIKLNEYNESYKSHMLASARTEDRQ